MSCGGDTELSRTCKGRDQTRYRVSLAVIGSFLAINTVAKADQIGALLTGYEESPSVSTTASGEFTATVAPDGNSISYTETYSGLQAPVTQSHIHVGQLGVNGSIVIFLCQTGANPDPTGLATALPATGDRVGDDHGRPTSSPARRPPSSWRRRTWPRCSRPSRRALPTRTCTRLSRRAGRSAVRFAPSPNKRMSGSRAGHRSPAGESTPFSALLDEFWTGLTGL